ncbi:MAG: metallophosphoesterase family protein [Candidatus Bathyarchaeia archaeon]|nr:metallophosphoesterase family protein [Candidatus Bathyarchaeia archaeon]MDI6904420.1 metallophosphoesterase family protein [Candidatus Bathyarchaeia archaeon]
METNLAQIVKEALEVQCEEFTRLVEETAQLLAKENGQVGNFNIMGRLVKIKPLGEALIVGDLHGDFESLIQILKESNFLQEVNRTSNTALIFLGDYGDRGVYSAEVYYIVLKLKLLFPEQVILMRGNHEGPEDLLASPHDLPTQFSARFDEKWRDAYSKIRELFRCLYNAVFVKDRYLMIHGSLPLQAKTLEDLAYAHIKHPKQTLFEDMLWSDPTEMIKGVCASPRGAGKLFGENITNEVLKRFNVKILIRGHEPCRDGFKINHKGKILTLFSRKGPPYFNIRGAYLNVELSQKFENAEQLIPYIHKF